MRGTINTQAIVIKRRPDRQDDCLVTLYTQSLGIIHARARSAYKPQSKLKSHLEPGKEIDVMLSTIGDIKILAQAVTRRTLFSHHPRINAVQVSLLKTASLFTESSVYQTAWMSLDALKIATNLSRLHAIFIAALIKIIDQAGIGLHMSSCTQCQTTSSRIWYTTPALGGLCCVQCVDDPGAVRVINIAEISACNPNTPSPIALPIIAEHLEWHTNKKMTYLTKIYTVEKQSV